MSSSAKTYPVSRQASWWRELVRPAMRAALVTSAALCLVEGLALKALVVSVALQWAMDWIKQPKNSGLVISLSSSQKPDPRQKKLPVSPLRRVSDTSYSREDHSKRQDTFSVPTIDTAPAWLQGLIASLGKPLTKPSEKQPRSLSSNVISLVFVLLISAVAVLGSAYLFNNQISIGPLPPWTALVLLAMISLIMTYRIALRSLYDAYTADAQTTGRHAFPALRR